MVSLFGYANTTKALAKKFKKAVFYDDKCHKPFIDENGFEVKPPFFFDENYSSLEIPSPGFPPNHELVKKAKNLISEYDFFSDSMPASVWISGTNGKTTTTQMTGHLLKEFGAEVGGNIGTPLANLDEKALLWVLETSSFTLHYTNKAKPNLYILLPVKPDHISWHGSFEDYEKSKLKPLLMMNQGDVAIVPNKYKDVKTDAFLITYNGIEDLAEYFDIDTDKIKFSGAFLLDAVLAMAVKKIMFDKTDYDAINSFEIEPHRQEKVYDKKNRLWINDTKATNIDAAIACIENFKDKKIHLILGGDDKGVDLSELFLYLKNKDITTYHIGSNTKKLNLLAKEHSIEHFSCQNLKDAVMLIDKNLQNDERAILSPAAASLDQFDSYAQRGDMFKEFISKL